MSSAPLECHDLVKHYGAVVGIDGVDLTVDAGSVKGFLGPNGAGKTTLLRIVTGLLHADRGTAEIFGTPVTDPAARRHIGYQPADPVFYDALTGRQNLDLIAALHGQGSPDRQWALATLDLRDDDLDRPVRTYSSGMLQKLAIVQAVQHRPALVVLDEPANRLDPLAQRAFEQVVAQIASAGRSVFLSSHALGEVETLCDSIAMIHSGRILVDAPAAELTAHAPRRITVRYSHPPASLPDGLEEPRLEGERLEGRVPAGRVDVVRAVLDDDGVIDVLVEPTGLDEIFYALYEHGVAALPRDAR